MTRRINKISFLHKAGLVIFGLILGLAVAEAILRLSGWMAIRCGAYRYETACKAYGLCKETPAFKILCLGDSSTYGTGADTEHSYPFQLWRLLDAKEPGRFKVVPIGLPGANSSQLANRYESYLKADNFNLVIFQAGSNDAYNLRECNIPLYASSRLAAFFDNTKLFYFLKIFFLKYKFSSGTGWTPEQENNRLIKNRFLEKRLWKETLRRNLGRLKDISAAYNVSFWVQNYHTPGWLCPETALREVYNELGLRPIEQQAAFEHAKGIRIRGRDGWHPNPYGYFIIARLIYNRMADEGIVNAKDYALFSEMDLIKEYIRNRGEGYEYLMDNQSRLNEQKFIEALHEAGVGI